MHDVFRGGRRRDRWVGKRMNRGGWDQVIVGIEERRDRGMGGWVDGWIDGWVGGSVSR